MMIQREMISDRGDCDITLLQCDDDVAEVLASMYPGQVVPDLGTQDGECLLGCKQEAGFVAIGGIDRHGHIRLWVKDRTIAESPAIGHLQESLEYFHSMRAKA